MLINQRITKATLRVFQVGLQSLIFLILPFAIFTFVTSKSPLLNGIQSMVVLSGSMEPTYKTGSVVYIKKEIAYNQGDAITFKNEAGQNVTHRVSDIKYGEQGTQYLTKGDANKVVDSQLVPLEKVEGKVFFSIPELGKIINFLNTGKGFLTLIILPSALFIAVELWNIKKEWEKVLEKKIMEKYNGDVNASIQV